MFGGSTIDMDGECEGVGSGWGNSRLFVGCGRSQMMGHASENRESR
jgi:hypothetical protein